MAKGPATYRTCVLCGSQSLLAPGRRCEACGAQLTGPNVDAIASADRAIAMLSERYEKLAGDWRQWLTYREYYARALEATRPAADPIGADAAADVAVEAASAEVAAQGAAWTAFAAPEPVADTVTAPERAPESEPAPASDHIAQPTPELEAEPVGAVPAPRRKLAAAADAITAPVLLGVAGAALLIAAAVVFVALAWTTFSPATRGLIVLAVAVAVSALAVWVRKLGLEVTSGAIGVVAMGFSGAASIAFFRESGTLGAFDIPAALLLACIAGVILARLNIPWVGPAAALALAGAAVGFTIAATDAALDADAGTPGTATVRGIWVWTLSGTVAASALAATRRVWRWQAARTVVTWSAVVWLSVVGVSVPLWMWGHGSVFADAVVGLAPVAALVVLAKWWPRLTVGPAALILTLLPAAAVDALGGGVWEQMTASAVAVGAMLALGPWAPRVVLWPLLIGVSPAFLTVAVASTTYSVSITVARIVAGTYVPDTNLWAGVAALVAGLSIAQLRLWKLESRWLSPLSVVGAGMTVVGAGIAAFGVAELTGPPLYHSSVAVVLTVVAAGLLAMMRAWTDPRARWTSAAGSLGFLVTAVVHGVWALGIAEVNLVLALIIAIAPIAVLVIRGWSSPWWGLPWAAPALMASSGALVWRLDGETSLVYAVMVAVAAAIAWLGYRAPDRAHIPVLAGLATAVGVAVVPIAWTITHIYEATDHYGRLAEPAAPVWSAGVLVFGIGLAGIRLWRVPRAVAVATSVVGASAVLLAAGGFATDATLASADRPGTAAAFWLVAAVAVGASVPLWRERAAAWTTGIGATVLAVLAGIGAELDVGSTTETAMLPIVVSIAAIAALAVPAKWFPKVVLAPAVALATGLGAALAVRTGATGSVVIAVAAIIGAAIVWGPWDATRSPFALIGALPALITGGLVGAFGTLWMLSSLWGADALQGAMHAQIAGILACLVALVAALWRIPDSVAAAGLLSQIRWLLQAAVLAVDVVATSLAFGFVGGATDSLVAAHAAASAAAIAIGALLAWATRAVAPSALATATARRVMRLGAIAWVGAMAMLAIGHAFSAAISATAAIGVVVATIAALAGGWRWWPRAVALPIAALATLAPISLWHVTAVPVAAIAFASTAIAAGLAWLARRARPHVAGGILWGLAPAGLVAAIADIAAAFVALALIAEMLGYAPNLALLSPWLAATLLMTAIGAAALPRVGKRWPILVLIASYVAVAALDPLLAFLLLAALALAALKWGRLIGLSDAWASATIAASGVWALGEAWQLAVVGAVGVVVLVTAALRQRETEKGWALTVLPAASALLGGAGCSALGFDTAIMAVAMAGVGVAVYVGGRLNPAVASERSPWILTIATIVLPIASGSPAASGATLVVAAVAWFELAITGNRFARGVCAATASLGTALIVFDAGLTAPEAYTTVPAAAALVIGLIAMRERPELSSLVAMGPGLAILLVPSYVALIANPNSILRTAWLTIAMVAMALVAVRMRWFAPVLATATTAIVVALVQIVVGSNLVLRMFAFIIVGSLLLAFASWFERLKGLR